MKNKQVKFLKQLLETPSATGTEIAVAELVRERLAGTADEIQTDVMGSVHARLSGTGVAPSLMLSAHMDEIGLMVTYISDEGFLSVSSVGGVDAAILPGMRVDVHASNSMEPLRGVVGRKPIHLIEPDERKSVTPIDKLVIDLGMPAKRVKKLVMVGDVITFGVGFERFGKNMAVSRAFDDKAGVWIATRVLETLAEEGRAPGDFIVAATVQEEIGTRGAITSTYGVNPDVAVAFDVTHATDYPGIDKTKYGKIVCGEGPVIARGPNINPAVFERLVAAAEAEGIPYQIEAEPGVTGTDARSIQITRGGIPTGLVSVALRYMHTPTEVVSLDDLDATVKLLVRFARDLGEDACFVPGMGDAVTEDDADAADDESAAQMQFDETGVE
ncbi:M42 family metallopeptidase [Eggerthella sinensis]|uniref:Peptidase M42 n=1 Tax=Eggerthella sinensis TaxID=242230 RepID=A0A3N0J0C3_9ACTN|nr:M42 family metallopeptidase [Eggerthella sinensis]MCB7037932.1 M42 family metallopeptidase [Eggerthella sinensis]RDB70411.1 peptidase M42 [Eggerthella sinensis]RNM42699.1 peptidase M42 [Eggerthella sinensis]